MEAFKHRISRQSIQVLGTQLERAFPHFDASSFVRRASRDLSKLELKDRVGKVAEALGESFEDPFVELAPRLSELCADIEDADMWVYWPLCTFVERYGIDEPEAAFRVMSELTPLASCEFAIRPYLRRYPELSFELLSRWVEHENFHVRRLVSEGTRPRLPWGSRLRELQADPSPSLPLLERLVKDPQLYVRRSVANHLNDISKDHPKLAVEVAQRWLERYPGDETDWAVRHALRGLIKQGHRGALATLGYGRARLENAEIRLSPRRLRFGGSLTIEASFVAKTDHRLIVDYVVHHRKANGELSPKVFKWKRLEVGEGQKVELKRAHKVVPISTRRYYAGEHRVELLINGEVVAQGSFHLVGV